MSRIAATIVCECCGQPIRKAPAARKPAGSFKGYDDFVPAFNAARQAAIAELGERWYLVPGASQWARIPAPWAACKVYGRVSNAPRDRRLPAAQFWPSGTMPVGPEYAAPDANTSAPAFRARVRELAEKHRRTIADMRAMHDMVDSLPAVRSAAYLAYLAGIRRQAAVAARCASFAEAA
jgi:hypothetical protein